MTQFLPPNLLTLFAARDPLPYLPPVVPLTHEKRTVGYSGVSQYLNLFEDPKDTPPPTKYETREERLERKRKAKQEQVLYKIELDIVNWNPNTTEKRTTDPFRTLFVGRLNYDTSESKLRRELEAYGPIKKIYVVNDKKSEKPRGYAFVEFEHERDMHSAYKHADGKKIDGRRVLVDVERGRTVKGWLPRRLGGGLGGTRRGGPEVNVKISGRDDADRDRFRDADPRDRGLSIGEDRRDRGDRVASRDRSRGRYDKVDRRVDRDRSKGRDRPDRRDRERSRDKDKVDRRGRERERSRDKDKDKGDRKDRDKSRDKDKDKSDKRDRDRSSKKRRHRSRSRDKGDKSDRKKVKKEKDRERDRDKVKTEDGVKVKDEPEDDYPHYESYGPYEDDGHDGPYDAHVKEEGQNSNNSHDEREHGNGEMYET